MSLSYLNVVFKDILLTHVIFESKDFMNYSYHVSVSFLKPNFLLSSLQASYHVLCAFMMIQVFIQGMAYALFQVKANLKLSKCAFLM